MNKLNETMTEAVVPASKVIFYPKSKLPKNIRVGETVTVAGKSGQSYSYIVEQILPNMAALNMVIIPV